MINEIKIGDTYVFERIMEKFEEEDFPCLYDKYYSIKCFFEGIEGRHLNVIEFNEKEKNTLDIEKRKFILTKLVLTEKTIKWK